MGSLQGLLGSECDIRRTAEPLVGIKTLAEYTDWMKGLMTIMPDGSYEVKSFATDTERNNVAAYGVFSGTHTGPGRPCEPTGKRRPRITSM